MNEAWNLTCFYVSPAVKCGIWENLALGILFYLAAIVSVYFLFNNCRKSKSFLKNINKTNLFWFMMIIYQLFRGTISIAPIQYNFITIKIVFLGVHHILLFIPMCLVILILFDLLFSYQNPGSNATDFFKWLFILFLVTFVGLGIALSIIDMNEESSDPEMSLSLWACCTDIILMLFFVIPAWSLLKAVTFPMIQPEDQKCVHFSRFGIFLNSTIFFLRALFNFLHYIEQNPIQNWILNQNTNSPDFNQDILIPNGNVRAWNFCYYFIFDFLPVVLAMIAVYLFKKHDMMFNENPYYTKQSD